jgi:patatin-like phospholipase/acyl hydrolase
MLLAAVEERDGIPIAKKFDLIAGTSTGGIIACAMAYGISANRLVSLYRDHGGTIFARSLPRKLATGFGTWAAKYRTDALQKQLLILGDARLSTRSLHCQLLVPTYCTHLPKDQLNEGLTEGASSMFFKTWRARADVHYDFTLRDVALATSAAPTFFPAAVIDNLAGESFSCVDGGVFANNPSLCALASAHELWPGEDVQLVSIGTGTKVKSTPAADWGLLQWGSKVSAVFMDGAADSVSYVARDLLGNRFIRCETDIACGAAEAFDDASPANIAALVRLGTAFANQFLPAFEAATARIT